MIVLRVDGANGVLNFTCDDILSSGNANFSLPLKNYTPKRSLPREVLSKFYEKNAKNFTNCFSFCCQNEKCDLVLFYNDKSACYNVDCHDDVDLCLPVPSNESTLFLSVRNSTKSKNFYKKTCFKI